MNRSAVSRYPGATDVRTTIESPASPFSKLALAHALGPTIRVNAIAPGAVLLPENMDRAMADRLIQTTPLKRLGSPDDVVRAIRVSRQPRLQIGCSSEGDGRHGRRSLGVRAERLDRVRAIEVQEHDVGNGGIAAVDPAVDRELGVLAEAVLDRRGEGPGMGMDRHSRRAEQPRPADDHGAPPRHDAVS